MSRTRSRLSPCDKRAGPTRFARAPRAESAGRTPLLPSRNSSETLAARRQQQASAPRASARPPDARGRGTRRTRGSRAPAPGPPGGEWSRQSLEHRGSHCGAPARVSPAGRGPRHCLENNPVAAAFGNAAFADLQLSTRRSLQGLRAFILARRGPAATRDLPSVSAPARMPFLGSIFLHPTL